MHYNKLKFYFFILFGISCSVLLSACDNLSDAKLDPRTVVPLVNTAVAQIDNRSQRTFNGVIAARIESNLSFRVAGKITHRLVDVGQHVEVGQPLMQLDLTNFTLELTEQQSLVEKAQAHLIQVNADLARMEKLIKQHIISAQDYDLAIAAAKSAKAQLTAAQARENIIKNAHQYTTLFADSAGTVMSIMAESGQVITLGQPVIKIAEDGPREALIWLPETLHPSLGSPANATLFSTNTIHSSAHLRELSHVADPITRTFAARYVLQEPAASAALGSTVVIHIDTQTDDRIMIPINAIHNNGQGFGVWVIDTQELKVSFRDVQIDEVNSEMAFLSDGLKSDELIVALGAHLLHEGQTIRPTVAKGIEKQ